jgi:hypothetical protein
LLFIREVGRRGKKDPNPGDRTTDILGEIPIFDSLVVAQEFVCRRVIGGDLPLQVCAGEMVIPWLHHRHRDDLLGGTAADV